MFEITELQNQLNGLGSTLDKVGQASKQAFEDGLLDFLSRGINQCESLGDAFRSMANTILQAIQRVYAEALTKNIMQAMGLGAMMPSSMPTVDANTVVPPPPGRADGGPVVEDQIQGPGTGVSDSILARLSRGEFVVNAAAVKKVGLRTLERINSGEAFRMRLPRFAEGGLVDNEDGTAKGIADFANSALNNGMGRLSASFGANFSPEIVVRNIFNGDGFTQAITPWIKSQIDEGYKRNMKDNAELQKRMLGWGSYGHR